MDESIFFGAVAFADSYLFSRRKKIINSTKIPKSIPKRIINKTKTKKQPTGRKCGVRTGRTVKSVHQEIGETMFR
jgi:hypothetical protein